MSRADSAKSISRLRVARLSLDVLYGAIPVGREEQRALDLVGAQVGGEGAGIGAAGIADAVAPDRVCRRAEPGAQPLEVRLDRPVEVAREQQPGRASGGRGGAARRPRRRRRRRSPSERNASRARLRAGSAPALRARPGSAPAGSRARRGSVSSPSARRPGRTCCVDRSQVALHLHQELPIRRSERLGARGPATPRTAAPAPPARARRR